MKWTLEIQDGMYEVTHPLKYGRIRLAYDLVDQFFLPNGEDLLVDMMMPKASDNPMTREDILELYTMLADVRANKKCA